MHASQNILRALLADLPKLIQNFDADILLEFVSYDKDCRAVPIANSKTCNNWIHSAKPIGRLTQ